MLLYVHLTGSQDADAVEAQQTNDSTHAAQNGSIDGADTTHNGSMNMESTLKTDNLSQQHKHEHQNEQQNEQQQHEQQQAKREPRSEPLRSRYRLAGIVHHLGSTAFAGHYIMNARGKNNRCV